MLRKASLVLAAFAAVGGWFSAVSAADIGNAIAVSNVVTAAFATDKRRLKIGDDVRQDEVIEVGAKSLGELKFKDETKLALGPGARLVLDKFVYDPEQTTGSIVMNLAKGTFRFITGIAAKPTYRINTPTASISVRGTIFDIDVAANGATWLLLIEGSVEVCNQQGVCRVLDEPGKIIRVDPVGKVAPPTRWTGIPKSQRINFEHRFPFVDTPPSIDPAPILNKQTILWGVLPLIPKRRGDITPPHYPGGDGPYGGTRGDGRPPYGLPGGTKTGDGKPPYGTPGGTKTGDGKPPYGTGGTKTGDHKPPYGTPGETKTGGTKTGDGRPPRGTKTGDATPPIAKKTGRPHIPKPVITKPVITKVIPPPTHYTRPPKKLKEAVRERHPAVKRTEVLKPQIAVAARPMKVMKMPHFGGRHGPR